MSRLHHVAVQPHARYVPPQRVLAVLSASPEGMALRDLWKRLGEGLPEWEIKK
jgi:hypothetical protein